MFQSAGRVAIAVQSVVTKAEAEVVAELAGVLDVLVRRADDITVTNIDPYVKVVVLGVGGEDLENDKTDVGTLASGEVSWRPPARNQCRYVLMCCCVLP